MFWFISDLGVLFFFFLLNHLYLFFVLLKPVFSLFSRSCSFPLSFFLSQPLSTFKYHHLFKSFFLFFFRKHGALLVHIPPDIFFLVSFLFYHIVILVVLNYELWFDFRLIWDFLPVSRSLSFVFPLFFFFSCWLSSTYDLIWIFVAFLTATGVVSLKSYFAIQYQNCNFIIRYLTYSTCTLLHCCFFYSNLFISIYSF